MNAINKTKTQVKENVQALDVTGKVTVALFGGAAALIGLWAAACFVGAVLSSGPVGVIKGYFSAVTGL
jgi:chitinase